MIELEYRGTLLEEEETLREKNLEPVKVDFIQFLVSRKNYLFWNGVESSFIDYLLNCIVSYNLASLEY